MSDHELVSAIKELAASGERAPGVTGVQVRRRAEGRRRRRRVVGTGLAVAVVAGCAVFGVERVLAGTEGGADRPAAPPSADVGPSPSVTGVPPFAVDAGRQEMKVSRDGLVIRTIPLTMDSVAEGRMTVVAKARKRTLRGAAFGLPDDEFSRSWVVELSRSDGSTAYVFETTADQSTVRNTIGVQAPDAAWLYGRLKAGDTVDVK